MKKLAITAVILFLTGCATSATTESDKAADADAVAVLEAIESRLQYAPVTRIDFTVEAGGAIAADMVGDLVLQKPGKAALQAAGEFAGAKTALRLISDGNDLRYSNRDESRAVAAPEDIHRGLLLGLVRMGVLHNLAMLSSGAPPEATEGVAPFFAQPTNVRWDDSRSADTHRVLQFDLVVNDQPAGDVAMWIDSVTGLPKRREQVVHFDHGDMRVIEHYEIELNGIIGPCRFDVAGITGS